jgi:hypothetical protein
VLRLDPVPGSVLLPDGLERVVQILESHRDLMFRVFVFDGVLKEGRTRFHELQAAVSDSDHGLELDWDGLVTLANDTYDVWDFLLVGFPQGSEPPIRAAFEQLAHSHEVAIEIFDSSSARFSFRSDALMKRAEAAFPAVQHTSLPE